MSTLSLLLRVRAAFETHTQIGGDQGVLNTLCVGAWLGEAEVMGCPLQSRGPTETEPRAPISSSAMCMHY